VQVKRSCKVVCVPAVIVQFYMNLQQCVQFQCPTRNILQLNNLFSYMLLRILQHPVALRRSDF
jgi:hypothetical protein